MSPRVYVPATLTLLAEWHAAGAVPTAAERVRAEADDEESEYAALMAAAASSAALTPADGRRVVVVAETAAETVPMSDVVAVHCDTEDRASDADPDDDLAWFASQEIPDLL